MTEPLILEDGETTVCGFSFYEGEGKTGRCSKEATTLLTKSDKELANLYWSKAGLRAPFHQTSKYACDSHAEDVKFIAQLQLEK